MTGFDIQEVDNYDDFVWTWHAEELDIPLDEARDQGLINEEETRLRWQLLGQLDDDELLIQIPDWLADEKVGFVDGSTPTEFVGRIDRETEKAILFADSAAARSLTKLAHRIDHLEDGIEEVDDPARRDWLESRLQDIRNRFERRDDAPTLAEEWLPKSQIQRAVRRR